MELQDLIGAWKLKSFNISYPDGTFSSWGNNAHGILIYTEEGYMSASLNRDIEEDESPFRQVVRSILFYSGTYSLEGDTITHHVQNASLRSRLGKDEVRKISFSGRTLTLTAENESGTAKIIWEKTHKK